MIHHARCSADKLGTSILNDESSLKLDPPGLEMAVAEFFPVD